MTSTIKTVLTIRHKHDEDFSDSWMLIDNLLYPSEYRHKVITTSCMNRIDFLLVSLVSYAGELILDFMVMQYSDQLIKV